MGGSSIDDTKTLVLVGRTGNGKSATGNSILQKRAFTSKSSSNGVTATCEQDMTVLPDGQFLNVIDTPGLFDFSDQSEFIGKEIVKCIDMAKDGIHAALLVLSVRTRFSKEEENAIQSLQNFLGTRINDYMIVVFTGGDDLEDNEETLEHYLGHNCPEQLKNILSICENRYVLFNNRTTDGEKKAEQVQVLLSLVDQVLLKNGGKPYTNDIFVEMQTLALNLHDQKVSVDQDNISELKEQLEKSNEDQLKRITEMVETKLKESIERLERQLAAEQAARVEAEKSAQSNQKRSEDEIRKLSENLEKAQSNQERSEDEISKLREDLEKAHRETEEPRQRAEKCIIL